MKQVRCKSGLRGWQGRLSQVYKNFDEFEIYCASHGIHIRLGFKDIRRCWIANPIVQGSVNPSDLRRVRESRTCWKCGSRLKKGYCTDQTCPYENNPQKRTLWDIYHPKKKA
jgi:hypothetical protein